MATRWAVQEWAWNYKADNSGSSDHTWPLQLSHMGGWKSLGKTSPEPCLPITSRDGHSFC